MNNDKTAPYHDLGERLKGLREKRRESLAEVSGAVEIAEKELEAIELGQDRPSEDILLLLFSYFDIEGKKAVELWRMAGYEGSPDGEFDFEEVQNGPAQKLNQQTIMVMVDPRIMYSDAVEAVAGDRGVVLNFSQMNGPNGQPLTISRIGMSRVQAQQLMGVLHQVLYDLDNPTQKRLNGPSEQPK